MIKGYRSLPPELELCIVQRACDSCPPILRRRDYPELACLGKVWQEVIEKVTFQRISINNWYWDITHFEEYFAGSRWWRLRRRSFLQRLDFAVDVSGGKSHIDNSINSEEVATLLSLVERESPEASAVGPTRPPSSYANMIFYPRPSAGEIVTSAYAKLFRVLATWSSAADRARFEIHYVFKNTWKTSHCIELDVEAIPTVTVIRGISWSPCIWVNPEENRQGVFLFLPSFLRLVTRMHNIERCQLAAGRQQMDQLSTMQAFKGKSKMLPVLPEHNLVTGDPQVESD